MLRRTALALPIALALLAPSLAPSAARGGGITHVYATGDVANIVDHGGDFRYGVIAFVPVEAPLLDVDYATVAAAVFAVGGTPADLTAATLTLMGGLPAAAATVDVVGFARDGSPLTLADAVAPGTALGAFTPASTPPDLSTPAATLDVTAFVAAEVAAGATDVAFVLSDSLGGSDFYGTSWAGLTLSITAPEDWTPPAQPGPGAYFEALPPAPHVGPEPSTLALALIGLVTAGSRARRRRR